ncbi:MAG: hypothetical protein DRN05_07565 [Thermoplasmata archaeon]|nr:MAG: hypothetical protein DRN05_07565 [Thermoplasmata archaeon]
MKLNTMAAVMTFITKVEEDSAGFYERCAERFPELRETFLSWSKENRRFEKTVKRTYYGVITDTIESNFSFEGLDTEKYEFDTELPQDADSSVIKKKAEEIERKIKEFYLKAAELSEGLLADIPRVLRKIAKKREERDLSL